MPILRPESPSYKELCREVYSITRVTHKDGKVPRATRGYSPTWRLDPLLEKRESIMIDAKRADHDFTASTKLIRPRPIKDSNRSRA